MSPVRGLACGVLGVALAAVPLAGQQAPEASSDPLLRADARVREGRIDEARSEIERWWAVTDGQATPENLHFALWLRGILTEDPDQADLDFQRIVMEFPRCPHAAAARLRLGLSAHARGQLRTALRHYLALDRDYPGTRFRLIARAWLDRYEALARTAREPGVAG